MGHDGDITTPIPRTRQRLLADQVRVRQGLRKVGQKAAPVAAQEPASKAATPGEDPRPAAPVRPRYHLGRSSIVGEHYRIIERIARGGTAIVYRAEHLQLNRAVALKVLTPPSGASRDEAFEQRFIREARTLVGLAHPNIVEILDFGRLEDGRCFLAMELLDGPRLSELFRDPSLDAVQRLDVLIQVCRAIAHAHEHGVIHRDIKLSNALVIEQDGKRVVKVLDFGLVKLMEGDDEELTLDGVTMGSPHFMSPEQARGVDLDHRTDIYSLGVLAWCAFTGEYPYKGATSAATMLQHVVEPVPRLDRTPTLCPTPPGMVELVAACMAKDPAARPASVLALLEALQRTRQQLDKAQAVKPPWTSRLVGANSPPSRLRMALLAMLLVSSACLWWQEQGQTPPPWTYEFQLRQGRGGG